MMIEVYMQCVNDGGVGECGWLLNCVADGCVGLWDVGVGI